MEEVQAIDQYVEGAGGYRLVHMEVLDTIDFDAAQKVKGKALGVSAIVMRSDKSIVELRKGSRGCAGAAAAASSSPEMMAKATPETIKQAAA